MSKIEYDNFPKFLVSLGIVLFALPILIVHFFLQENTVLLITEQDLSQLTPMASQVIMEKQNLCLWLTKNVLILSVVCVLFGFVLLFSGCKMWYLRQKIVDDKQDVELQTAKAQLKKMTTEEKNEKIVSEVLEMERPNIIDGEHDCHNSELSIEELQSRQEAVLKENRVIYRQITQRYTIVEKAVVDRLRATLETNFTINDNVKINNLVYDAIAISKEVGQDYIFEVKYLFSKNSWSAASLHAIVRRMTQQVTNYVDTTGRKATAVLIVVTLKGQATQTLSLLKGRLQEEDSTINICTIDENELNLFDVEKML